MKYRSLGRTGICVSEVGVGAWAMGGGMWGGARDDDSRQALARAHALGVNFIDTALVYGMGHSEKLVGEFVRAHRDVVVATKVPPKSQRWPAPPGSELDEFFPPQHLRDCCDRSLKNLGLERIDLLQLHVWADAWADRDEWFETLSALRDAGKIRAFGISINSHDPGSALRVVKAGRVDAVQVIYNVFDQSPGDELFAACQAHQVGVLARVPFDEGSLTGKLREDTVFPEGDFRKNYFGGKLLGETVRRVEAARPILAGAATSMARGALRFVLSHPAVSTVIPGMRNVPQAEENCAASDDGPLPPEVLKQLEPHRWVRDPYR
jgi:aryl-alcohol dehydrogenase-like predicted oxidoreductase